MKTINHFGFLLLFVSLVLSIIVFQNCEPEDDGENEPDCDTCNIVRKPNIYIYPTEIIQLTLKLDFPLGGEILASIPDYNTGWNISVDTNGLINNTYTHLFYESTQPDVWQEQNGWIIKANELESFFRINMSDYGFEGQEIDDFVNYWIPQFDKYSYYSIYPQTQSIINDVIVMDFSNQPDNLLRLFYVIKGSDQILDKLTEPTIDDFEREGYFITEWGVILK